jgi:hypothetical protein
MAVECSSIRSMPRRSERIDSVIECNRLATPKAWLARGAPFFPLPLQPRSRHARFRQVGQQQVGERRDGQHHGHAAEFLDRTPVIELSHLNPGAIRLALNVRTIW